MERDVIAESPSYQTLLGHLKQTRGFDFTLYKPSSLSRRIEKRMERVGIDDYDRYMDYLEVHPEEYHNLFNMILINVTGFYRDPETWEYLQTEIVPRILAGRGDDEPIRVWSAGCASGEEAYTLAMVFAEALGMAAFRRRVKIYATDLDEDALDYARQGSYAEKEIATVPPSLRGKYFEEVGGRYLMHNDLRRAVIFGRHDLLQDAPISRIDLLVCRNVMIYFNSEAQTRLLSRFHFALNDSGYLFMGKAEILFTHTTLFSPIELKCRIFSKVMQGNLRDRLHIITQAGSYERDAPMMEQLRIHESAFQAEPLAQIVADNDGIVAMINERAIEQFNLDRRDVGRPLYDLELFRRPLELRSGIDMVYKKKYAMIMKNVEWSPRADDRRYLDVRAIPLFGDNSDLLGVKIIFDDATHSKRALEELQHSKHELEMAYEELQSSNEEVVTTNEELQSTMEELETANAELRSTNRELERMNETLQVANGELQRINVELRQRCDELRQSNVFLESILASFPAGVVVIDRSLRIHIWNDRAAALWGCGMSEVRDQHLMTLDIGLPVETLKPLIRACLTGQAATHEIVVPATTQGGKAFLCKVTGMPLIGNDAVNGVILLMDEKCEGREEMEG